MGLRIFRQKGFFKSIEKMKIMSVLIFKNKYAKI